MVQRAGSQGGPRGAALPRGHAPERGGDTAPAQGAAVPPWHLCQRGSPRCRTPTPRGQWGMGARRSRRSACPPSAPPVLPRAPSSACPALVAPAVPPRHAVLRAGTGQGAGLPSWGLLAQIASVKVGHPAAYQCRGCLYPERGCGLPDRAVGLQGMCLPCSANARYPGSDILGEPPSLGDALSLSSEDISVPCAGEKLAAIPPWSKDPT